MRGLQERGAVAALSRHRAWRLALAAGVTAAVVAADQVTTSLALGHLHHPVHLFGPLGLALGFNSGSAFSLFSGAAPELAVVAVVVVALLAWLVVRAPSPGISVALGLVLGGALGNLWDRLLRGRHGDVVDFITLSHWPTFNLADASITAGVVWLVVAYVLRPVRRSA